MSAWQDFEVLLSSRPEPPLHEIDGKPQFGPSRDDEAPDDAPVVEVDLEGLTIGISYRDGRGDPSFRVIRCHRLSSKDGLYYIQAECQLRKAARTFRLDRIVEVTDYSTGEVIADVAGFFSIYLEEDQAVDVAVSRKSRPKAPSSWLAPTSQNPRVAAAFRDGARILLYLAMSDGHLHEAERALVINYSVARLKRLKQPPLDPESIVRRWVDNHVPSRASAFSALGRISLNYEDGAELGHALVDLILADGEATDGEMSAAWGLVKALEERARTRPAPWTGPTS
jgi:hypothetical protein